jgi:hypothetical protein
MQLWFPWFSRRTLRTPQGPACLRTSWILLATLLLAPGWGGIAQAQAVPKGGSADRIRPWTENPWYWQYRGKPILLLGGSKDDNLFQIPDLRQHLDEITRAGGNYIRNTMSDRVDLGLEIYPFAKLEDGRYDLEQWNERYWERFANLLQWTFERDIIVQIEVWDRFDYSREDWAPHPYNPRNNINYTHEESGLEDEYPNHPGSNEQPFFFTTPAQRHNKVVLPHQEKFVAEMLRHSLPYPHVLYCIDNETSGEEAWAIYWSDFIQQRAREAGVDVFLTEMWDDWNLQAPQHRRTFDHPERYAFVDVSQNNHQQGETHWKNFQWARQYLARQPRPINTVKTYGADTGRYGTDRDGVERWWRHLVGGAAAVRFHRPDSGLGLSETAVASIQAARKVESLVQFWNVDPANELLRERREDEAYLAAKPGVAYVLYFPDGGAVELDLRQQSGRFKLYWINIDTGEWDDPGFLDGGNWRQVSAPTDGHWAVAIWKD